MTFLAEDDLSTLDARGSAPARPESTWGQIFDRSRRATVAVDNFFSRERMIEEAYDRRIDQVFKATGQRLDNPTRRAFAPPVINPNLPVPEPEDHFGAFQTRLEELGRQFPDRADAIRADVSPRSEAEAKAKRIHGQLEEAMDDYRGPWGTGTVAALAGGVVGSFYDPMNAAANFIGATGRAGAGLKGLAWMAMKQGAVNASVETALQPQIAQWRQQAGIKYGLDDFLMNTGAAFVFGAGLDAVGRGAVRGINRYRGSTPSLDADGGITGWRSPKEIEASETAARRVDALRAAADGDVAGLRKAAQEFGLDDDPEYRSIMDTLADLEATEPHRPGFHEHESDQMVADTLRHMFDPAEPAPAPLAPLPGRTIGDVPDPRVTEARAQLNSGELDVVQSATIMRQVPRALDETVSLASQPMRDARALSRLSEDAFGAVASGEASPVHGALVGRFVTDQARHGYILDRLTAEAPATEAEARRMIRALVRPVPTRAALDRAPGIDVPGGPEAKAQRERLEVEHKEDIAAAKPQAGVVDPLRHQPIEELAGIDLKLNSRGFEKPAFLLMEAMRAGGVPAVQRAIGQLGPARLSDAIGRLAGDMTREATELPLPRQAMLLGGRALRRLGDELGPGERPAQLRERLDTMAADLEARAFAQEAGDPDLVARFRTETLAKLGKTIRHPEFPQVELPVAADGTVALYRGVAAGPARGRMGHLVFTTDLERALRNAKDGRLDMIRLPVARAGDLEARSGGDRMSVPAGTDVFILPDDLAGTARTIAGEAARLLPAAVRAALDETPAGRLMRDANEMKTARALLVSDVMRDFAALPEAQRVPAAGASTGTLRVLLDKLVAKRLEPIRKAAGERKVGDPRPQLGGETIAHPMNDKLLLPLDADRMIRLYRVSPKTGEQVSFTTDLEAALKKAVRGEVEMVAVPAARVGEIEPKSFMVEGKASAGEREFFLSEGLREAMTRVDGRTARMVPAAVKAALDAAPEVSLTRSLDDAEALMRLKEIVEMCRL